MSRVDGVDLALVESQDKINQHPYFQNKNMLFMHVIVYDYSIKKSFPLRLSWDDNRFHCLWPQGGQVDGLALGTANHRIVMLTPQ